MAIDPKEPIWKLVEHCATELTQASQAPFTRGELIRCVRTFRPGCRKDTINPIIQGMTENLRGGASGAVGKNILYSVERGKFVLVQHRGQYEKVNARKRGWWLSPTEIRRRVREAPRGLAGVATLTESAVPPAGASSCGALRP